MEYVYRKNLISRSQAEYFKMNFSSCKNIPNICNYKMWNKNIKVCEGQHWKQVSDGRNLCLPFNNLPLPSKIWFIITIYRSFDPFYNWNSFLIFFLNPNWSIFFIIFCFVLISVKTIFPFPSTKQGCFQSIEFHRSCVNCTRDFCHFPWKL